MQSVFFLWIAIRIYGNRCDIAITRRLFSCFLETEALSWLNPQLATKYHAAALLAYSPLWWARMENQAEKKKKWNT